MGSNQSKFDDTIGLEEYIQRGKAEGTTRVLEIPVDLINIIAGDPRDIPVSLRVALIQCSSSFSNLTDRQVRGLGAGLYWYAYLDEHLHHFLTLAQEMKGSEAEAEEVLDFHCAYVLWVIMEERKNTSLIKLLSDSARGFRKSITRHGVTEMVRALLELQQNRRCCYKHCPRLSLLSKTFKCLQCGVVSYCGKACQEKAWHGHKEWCKAYHQSQLGT